MAPTIPFNFAAPFRGQHGGDTDSSGSDLSVPATVIYDVSSSLCSVIDLSSSSDIDEATSRRKAAARRPSSPAASVRATTVEQRRRPSSPPSPAAFVRATTVESRRRPSPPPSPAASVHASVERGQRPSPPSSPAASVRARPVSTVAASSDTSGDGATRQPSRAAQPLWSPVSSFGASFDISGDGTSMQPRRRRFQSSSAVSGLATGGEVTSRPRRARAKTQKWSVEDERELLATMARLCKENHGVVPYPSAILAELCASSPWLGHRLQVTVLSQKIHELKKKFEMAVDNADPNGGKRRRRTRRRNRELYELSRQVWGPEHFADDAYLDLDDPIFN